jgi:hypothetical protein
MNSSQACAHPLLHPLRLRAIFTNTDLSSGSASQQFLVQLYHDSYRCSTAFRTRFERILFTF